MSEASGERIALFEARLSAEISQLVRRSGAEPVCVPAVRERRRAAPAEVNALLDEVAAPSSPVFVFSTGVGVSALFEEARSAGRTAELRDAISRGVSVCRGPKPVAALHKQGIAALVRALPPFTTAELLAALSPVEVQDRLVVLVHYGEVNEPLLAALRSRGARLRELTLYEWALPEDTAPLRQMVEDLVQDRFSGAAFTSQIQARNLMAVAEGMGREAALVAALRARVVVAAVGPTCARALTGLGVPPHVVPGTPKMGAMVSALVAQLARERTR